MNGRAPRPRFQRHTGPDDTTGGSLKTTRPTGRTSLHRPVALPWGPHRPYEGSQHHVTGRVHEPEVPSSPLRGFATLEAVVQGQLHRVPSSPLRGFATSCRTPRTAPGQGPHRPYEGSQPREVRPHVRRCLGPHRPCEGSQLLGLPVLGVVAGPSSPLRGFATGASTAPTSPPAPRPHRPYEGSQRSSSRSRRSWIFRPSSPLRGFATCVSCAPSSCAPGPHRPCEGSQQQMARVPGPAGRVLVAPARDVGRRASAPMTC